MNILANLSFVDGSHIDMNMFHLINIIKFVHITHFSKHEPIVT